MNRFVRATSIATVLLAASLASGAAQAQHINVPFKAANGNTYMWDRSHCLHVWTQRGWARQGCHTATQAHAHNQMLIGDIQRRLRAEIAAQQQRNALAAQRQQQEHARVRAQGGNMILHRNPDGSTGISMLGPDPNVIANSPRATTPDWFQGDPQYRR